MANNQNTFKKNDAHTKEAAHKGGQASHSGDKQGSFASMDERTQELAHKGGQASHKK